MSMTPTQLISALESGALDAQLTALYGAKDLTVQKARYAAALRAFAKRFGEAREVSLISAPGRTELSGNHTDHNRGRVLAAAVDLDIIAVAAPNAEPVVRLASAEYSENRVGLSDFTAPRPEREPHSDALIAGVCAELRARGYAAGGFDAYTTSNVPKGSGLSSSAAFENAIGTIENHLYNGGAVDALTLAQISQAAENHFFGKPCGLMDQAASAVGGVVAMDFADERAPRVEKIPFDFTAAGYRLCIVHTGGNHADLTPDYAAVPAEMKAVAAAFGKTVLREVDEAAFSAALPALRARVGDRAVLRALHFFAENRRVAEQTAALKKGDVADFLSGVRASGLSSFCYLQNVYAPENPAEQGISLALCLADRFLAPVGGVCRVHGGGFAGTVQAFVPNGAAADFRAAMDAVFGAGACRPLSIREQGAFKLI